MYRTRKFQFTNGRSSDGVGSISVHDCSVFVSYIEELCNKADDITPTQLVSVKEHNNRWTIKIKNDHKTFFNTIIRKFIEKFGDYISDIEY